MRYTFTRPPRSYEKERPAQGVALSPFELAEYLREATCRDASHALRVNARRAVIGLVLGGLAIVLTIIGVIGERAIAGPSFLLGVALASAVFALVHLVRYLRSRERVEALLDYYRKIPEGGSIRDPMLLARIEALVREGEVEEMPSSTASTR